MGTVKDPVCGMEVDEETAVYKSIYENKVFYFHSSACQAEFLKNPDKHTGQADETRHATHYGGYCGVQGCGKPARGLAWYMYFGLLLLVLLILLLAR